jgi:hypothetical protein
MKEIHLLIINKNTALYKEALEENLREKNNYYLLENKLINFWLSNSSTILNNNYIRKLLKNTNFFDKIKFKLNNNFFNSNFTIIYSLDHKFIEWVALRLGYCEYKKMKKFNNKIVLSNNKKDDDYITSPQGLLLSIDTNLLKNNFNLINN